MGIEAHEVPPSAALTVDDVELLREQLWRLAEQYRADPTTDERIRWENDRIAAGIDRASAPIDGLLEAIDRRARQQRTVRR